LLEFKHVLSDAVAASEYGDSLLLLLLLMVVLFVQHL